MRTILAVSDYQFFLIESRDCPSDRSGFKTELVNDEAFKTEFVGASEQDCQNWALEKQRETLFIEPNIIAIANARTAKNGTILMQWYHQGEGEDIPPYGILPPKSNTWYDFRIDPENAEKVVSCLNFTEPDVVYPSYFGRKEELTDENGVFDPVKADRIICGEDTNTLERDR